MSTLERAVAIAAAAHAGQTEKNGAPYLLHPLRVMLAVSTPAERIAAVLHDVVEDTTVTLDDLRAEGFSAEVLDAVALLTHDSGVPYFDYVRRAAEHPIARTVKMADLRDNLDPSRLAEFTSRDRERFARYRVALQILDPGGPNPSLRHIPPLATDDPDGDRELIAMLDAQAEARAAGRNEK